MSRLLLVLTIVAALAVPAGSLRAQPAQPPVRPAVLAEVRDVQVPSNAGWCMTEMSLRPALRIIREHGIEFLYVLRGYVEASFGGQTVRIDEGRAGAIPAGVRRVYRGEGRIVSFVLGSPAPSWDEVEVHRATCSERLTGFRPGPQVARLVRVAMSPGAQTPVHTHPGPEVVYAPDTPIILQTEGRLRWVMGRDLGVVPGDSPLQARNISAGEAWFLALFIVAQDALFQSNIPGGFLHAPHAHP